MEKVDGVTYFLSKKVGKALTDYKMIDDGDRILVAVSGGKDSLTTLKILQHRRSFVPVDYSILAVYIDTGYYGMNPRTMANWFKKEGYDYHIKKIDILRKRNRKSINCFWCSANRRRALFEVADKFGCNKIALGHHKDDIIETVLMNLFFNGEISAMAPKQELFKGKMHIIRPLAYAEEKEVVRFAKRQDFPKPGKRCPNSESSQRAHVRAIIKELEKVCPHVKSNIFTSLKRIKKDYLL